MKTALLLWCWILVRFSASAFEVRGGFTYEGFAFRFRVWGGIGSVRLRGLELGLRFRFGVRGMGR